MLFATLAAGEGLDVLNPATEDRIATVRSYSPEEIAGLIERADAARPAWAARTAKDRAVVLRRWHDLIMARQDDLAALVTAESGKPLAEARGEVAYGAAFIEWFAEEGKRAYGETIPTFAPGKRVLTIRQAVGTCAAITPWNFPIAMITCKVAPALAAGCAMVVKPAEATPLSALTLEALAHEAGVPADLFRVAPTADPAGVGTLFCTHPLVRKLSFTGSTRVGQILMEQAAANVTRLSLELGGNAPFIVFDDADLDAAVDGLMASKFRNAGQTCVCANRILVQDGVHDAFVAKLTARVEGLVVGDGAAPGVTIGPLINRAAAGRVRELVGAARKAGASVIAGGKKSDAGAGFFEPTILTGVTPDLMTVAKAMAGGFPISGVMGKAEIMDAPDPGGLGGTYGGSPLGCAAGLAVLDVIAEENLCARAVEIGNRIKARLRGLRDGGIAAIGDVRGPGAMIALELVRDGDASRPDPELTRAIVQEGAKDGLLLLSCGLRGNVVRFLPALTMPDALLDEALDKLEGVIRRAVGG